MSCGKNFHIVFLGNIFCLDFRRRTIKGLGNFFVMNLIQQWHPDKWARNPSLLGDAKQKFQKIQEAYSGNLHRSKGMFSISLLLCNLKFIYLTPNWSMIEQSYQTGKEEGCMMQDCMALILKMKKKMK